MTFSDLDLDWGYVISGKHNCSLHFLAHFSSEWEEIWCGVEAIKVEHPDITLEW